MTHHLVRIRRGRRFIVATSSVQGTISTPRGPAASIGAWADPVALATLRVIRSLSVRALLLVDAATLPHMLRIRKAAATRPWSGSVAITPHPTPARAYDHHAASTWRRPAAAAGRLSGWTGRAGATVGP